MGQARAGEELIRMQSVLSLGKPLLEHRAGSTCEAGTGLS